MFSYGSNKNSQTTLENDLIEEIQFLANQIFDPPSFSNPKTELQEMSLQLSPATSQEAEQQSKHNHQDLSIHLNYLNQTLPNQASAENPFAKYKMTPLRWQESHSQKKNGSNFKKNNKNKKTIEKSKQQQFERLSKSMISSNNFKEPGSFSRNYIQKENTSNSQIKVVEKNHERTPKTKNEKEQQKQALYSSNQNKVNILKGLIGQNSNSKQKGFNKKSKFSQPYSSNYISPYSKRGMVQNPNSYKQKSVSKTRRSKQAYQIEFIKKKINENIEPQISHRINQQKYKNNNNKHSHVKSKYKQTRPLFHEHQVYLDQHIYKPMKEQMHILNKKNQHYRQFSSEQIENNWKSFIQNERNFIEYKKQWLAAKKLQKFHQQKVSISPNKTAYDTQSDSYFEPHNPYKMTPEDFVKKYKRQKDKLKQKIQSHEISNFTSKKHNELIKSRDFQTVQSRRHKEVMEFYQNEKRKLRGEDEQKKLSSLLIPEQKSGRKNGQQNFFISIGQEMQGHNFNERFLSKYSNLKRQNQNEESSSYFDQKPKSSNRVSSKDSRSPICTTERSTQRNHINSLVPFSRKQNYLSKDNHLSKDKSQIEEHFFLLHKKIKSQLLQNSKSRSIKNKKKSIEKQEQIKELINPKYFKSINEMHQYSQNSKQKKQHSKKTFEKSPFKIQQKIKIQQQKNISLNSRNNMNHNIKIGSNSKSPQKNKQSRITNLKVSKFDQNLMNQIVKDLNQMRSQIEENKKNRKYKIENYSNFSNLREIKKDQNPHQQTAFFKMQITNSQRLKERNQQLIKREQNQKRISRLNNHCFKKENNNQELYQNERLINISRSVSPIEQEKTINERSMNEEFSSRFYDQEEASRKSSIKYSGVSRSIENNSNVILVKSRQQVEFILGEE